MNKIDIKSMLYDDLKRWLEENGYLKFRANQIFSWLHKKNIGTFDEMSNISVQLKQQLSEHFYINNIKIHKKLVSSIDNTVKYLYMLLDGEYIESAVMKYNFGRTICISSQVGCKMGCSFCASARAGYSRQLTVSEMLDQIYVAQRDIDDVISNVVLMGIGEPLDNYDNLIKFLKIISDEKGRNLGMRHITISTCGLVDKIYTLSNEGLPVNLSVSLHAPNDDIRSRIMPIAKMWRMDELLKACRIYAEKTHRRITFEYACIKGVNASCGHALELADKIKGMLCHVNLIPVNLVKGSGLKGVSDYELNQFYGILKKCRVPVTIRRTLGQDINASCGQLRRDAINS